MIRAVVLAVCLASAAVMQQGWTQTPGLPRLTAVIITPRERLAVFDDQGQSVVASENEVVAGHTVRSIVRGRVELERGGRRHVLELSGSAQLPPADPMGVTYGVVLNPQLPTPD